MPAGEKVTVGREYIMPVCLARPFMYNISTKSNCIESSLAGILFISHYLVGGSLLDSLMIMNASRRPMHS